MSVSYDIMKNSYACHWAKSVKEGNVHIPTFLTDFCFGMQTATFQWAPPVTSMYRIKVLDRSIGF